MDGEEFFRGEDDIARGDGRPDEGIKAFEFTVASTLAGKAPPERPWVVKDWLPGRQVTLLAGDGGVGKSLLSMQLMAAAAGGGKWLGLPVTPCRAFGVFAEDDDGELHLRLEAICRAADVDMAALDGMAWRCAIVDACELVEADSSGKLHPTDYYRQLEAAIHAFGARLVVLDAATNLYGGDELKRRQVNAFISLLRRLAIDIDGAVVLLSHPSAQGLSTGSGMSGSTHWNNAVRSRLYFEHATSKQGEDADPDERIVTRKKGNYAEPGGVIRARWTAGAFTPIEPPSGIDRASLSAKAERVFLALLKSTYEIGSWCSANPSANNSAPRVFAKHPDSEGLAKPHFEAAMYRMLKDGRIKTESYGPPSQGKSRLALA